MAFVKDFLDLTVRGDGEAPMQFSDDFLATNAATVYFKAAAVDTALSYISGALSKCEIKTFERDEEVKGPLYGLFNYQPNPNQNAAQFMADLVNRLLLDGEALIVEMRNHLYVAESFAIEINSLLRNRFTNVVVEREQIRRSFLSDKACYLRYGNRRAKDLINGIWNQYSRLMSTAFDGYAQHAGVKWKLNFDAPQTGSRSHAQQDEKERQDPTGPLKKFMADANSVFIQHQGYDLTQFPTSENVGVKAGEIIELRKEQFELVASVFKIPPPMIFGNMTNVAELTKQFLTYAVDPLADQIGKELTIKFYKSPQILSGSRVVVDTTRVNHIDIFEIAPAISALIGSGFSLDEMRDATGWPRIGTEESQEHLITRNFGPLEEVLAAVATAGAGNVTASDAGGGE